MTYPITEEVLAGIVGELKDRFGGLDEVADLNDLVLIVLETAHGATRPTRPGETPRAHTCPPPGIPRVTVTDAQRRCRDRVSRMLTDVYNEVGLLLQHMRPQAGGGSPRYPLPVDMVDLAERLGHAAAYARAELELAAILEGSRGK